MAKREKTYWAIKKGDGSYVHGDINGGPSLFKTKELAMTNIRFYKEHGHLLSERPVRVKLVEVE